MLKLRLQTCPRKETLKKCDKTRFFINFGHPKSSSVRDFGAPNEDGFWPQKKQAKITANEAPNPPPELKLNGLWPEVLVEEEAFSKTPVAS